MMTQVEKEAARYRWLVSQLKVIDTDGGYSKSYSFPRIDKQGGNPHSKDYKWFCHENIDDAIDAAMKGDI